MIDLFKFVCNTSFHRDSSNKETFVKTSLYQVIVRSQRVAFGPTLSGRPTKFVASPMSEQGSPKAYSNSVAPSMLARCAGFAAACLNASNWVEPCSMEWSRTKYPRLRSELATE